MITRQRLAHNNYHMRYHVSYVAWTSVRLKSSTIRPFVQLHVQANIKESIVVLITNVLLGLTTVYPKKYAHSFCFAVLCCGYTLTDLHISIRLTSLALWQSNDCPSASKATLMNMDKYFTWIHYERLHNHNKAKHNNTVCIFLGIYCIARQVAFLLLFLPHPIIFTLHLWELVFPLSWILELCTMFKGLFDAMPFASTAMTRFASPKNVLSI